MAKNPLSPRSIMDAVADALPNHDQADASPYLSSPTEAIALFTHSSMVNQDFRLLSFEEDQDHESEYQALAPRLSPKWNASGSAYSFVYAHPQSSKKFVIKVDRMGRKAEIRGLAVDDETIARLEVTPDERISTSSLPLHVKTDSQGNEDRSDLPSRLQSLFLSPERVSELAALLNDNIIQKLIPGLQKEESDGARNPVDRTAYGHSDQHYPTHLDETRAFEDSLLQGRSRRPVAPADFAPPDFEDEHEVFAPARTGAYPIPGGGPSPYNIGHDDLHPPGLGPHDPLRASFTPAGGVPRPGGVGNGMHPRFEDALFQQFHEREPGREPYDLMAPPGARWDPLGPGGRGGPRFGGGRPGSGWDNAFGGDII